MKFDKELESLRSWSALFHTTQGKNWTAFNNWNFTTSYWWDSVKAGFWFHETTTILFYSKTYVIGTQQLELMNLRLQPEQNTHLNTNASFSILKIPYKWKNYIEKKVIWRKVAKVDEDN